MYECCIGSSFPSIGSDMIRQSSLFSLFALFLAFCVVAVGSSASDTVTESSAEAETPLPRDDCIDGKMADLMSRQLDVLEERAILFLSQILGIPRGDRLSNGLFVPGHVGIYGGRLRSSTGADRYDANCSGAIDNRSRAPFRLGKSVFIRYAIPAFVRSVVLGVGWGPMMDEDECHDYISMPNLRFHQGYIQQRDRLVDAQLNMRALVNLMSALRDTATGDRSVRVYFVKIALRYPSHSGNASFSIIDSYPKWRLAPRDFECRRVNVTRETIDQFVGPIRMKLERLEEASKAAAPRDIGTTSKPRCSSYGDEANILTRGTGDSSLNRVAYELGYAMKNEMYKNAKLTDSVSHNGCNLFPHYSSNELPAIFYVSSTFKYYEERLRNGSNETGFGMCVMTSSGSSGEKMDLTCGFVRVLRVANTG